MFRGWGFLLGEIWALIALAALLGLFVGWLIWARRGRTTSAASQDEMGRLRAELTACQAKDRNAAARIDALEAELAAARHQAAPAAEPAAQPETAPAAVLAAPRAEAIAETPDEPASEPAQAAGTRPARLDAPRDGAADDLKRIKGIGPKLELLCNRLGFWHFDQIANWTEAEIAWVDANLEAFKGRVTRDHWVAQARVLAAEAQG